MMRESKEPRLYRLGKKAISQYVQTGCRLRLRFDMHAGDVSRSHAGIPPKDGRNPGLLVSHGRAHERAAFRELYDVFPGRVFFGPEVVEADDERAFQKIALGDYLPTAEPGDFIVEGEFEVCAGFRRAHGLRDLETGEATAGGGRMTYSKVRPDIVRVEACGAGERRAIRADGEIRTVPAEDARHGLRIVDVKLASEPGPAHFAELAYYAMTLDAWLAEAGLDDRFLVLADAGIWPGNHEGSALKALLDAASGGPLDQGAASDAWLSSLEILPAEVVTERVKRFLAVELREVVSETDWARAAVARRAELQRLRLARVHLGAGRSRRSRPAPARGCPGDGTGGLLLEPRRPGRASQPDPGHDGRCLREARPTRHPRPRGLRGASPRRSGLRGASGAQGGPRHPAPSRRGLGSGAHDRRPRQGRDVRGAPEMGRRARCVLGGLRRRQRPHLRLRLQAADPVGRRCGRDAGGRRDRRIEERGGGAPGLRGAHGPSADRSARRRAHHPGGARARARPRGQGEGQAPAADGPVLYLGPQLLRAPVPAHGAPSGGRAGAGCGGRHGFADVVDLPRRAAAQGRPQHQPELARDHRRGGRPADGRRHPPPLLDPGGGGALPDGRHREAREGDEAVSGQQPLQGPAVGPSTLGARSGGLVG
ncbi:Superfamily I DNA and RNA helicase, helicase subunits-like protein (N-terminal part) (plasmid) [Methylorubrum extorquens AM1]|uniref:Superfamily I DNA and RNA helicase, helicase subunits-like protein (N-terminal part) n=1 Tax=Methylorubrum extorquens (strain ATCC 14718 / DSM 1338 / JCM 2805 / NCIMB 9133 / AM1) TaxID=272630 RepID=C5B5C2_METEA|nr:Superfamily I DNA and RNA helicase, helicase subunits-like protein (N-terminal part) [Methylorubrum extorquens AM1]